MEINVIFLGILKYQDKKDSSDKYRISYILDNENSKLEESNFKGVREFAIYINSSIPWEVLKKEDILTSMKFIMEEIPSSYNPFKKNLILKSIITKKTKIDLC